MPNPDSRQKISRTMRIGLCAAILALVLAVCPLHPGYAMDREAAPATASAAGVTGVAAWTAQIWSGVTGQLAALWSPVQSAFQAALGITPSSTATTTDGSGTDGSAGFDPGGGGGFIDPNGSF